MTEFDNDHYFAQRAIIEREIADRSSDHLVAGIHRELANRYAAKCGQSNNVPLTMIRS